MKRYADFLPRLLAVFCVLLSATTYSQVPLVFSPPSDIEDEQMPMAKPGTVRYVSESEYSPALKKIFIEKQAAMERAKLGGANRDIYLVPDGTIGFIESYKPMLKKSFSASDRAIPLDHIQSQNLSQFKFLGYVSRMTSAEGITQVGRMYQRGNILMLIEEWDFVKNGGGITTLKQRINEDVNGTPAILFAKTSSDQKLSVGLTWATYRRNFVVTTEGNLDQYAELKPLVLEIARSMTPSTQ